MAIDAKSIKDSREFTQFVVTRTVAASYDLEATIAAIPFKMSKDGFAGPPHISTVIYQGGQKDFPFSIDSDVIGRAFGYLEHQIGNEAYFILDILEGSGENRSVERRYCHMENVDMRR